MHNKFDNVCLKTNGFWYIFFKEFRVENGYFHIEIMISATEMIGGSGACSPRKF